MARRIRRGKPSRGEQAVLAALRAKGIPFIHDKAAFFEGRQRLRPDVVVPSHRLVIEFDGEQHFRKTHKYGDPITTGRRSNDEYKDRACYFAGIHLARVPFTVPTGHIARWVDEALTCAEKGTCLLTAYQSSYYEEPYPLPRRSVVIDLTQD